MKKLIAAGIDPEALLAEEDEDDDLALLDALPTPKPKTTGSVIYLQIFF